MSGKAYDGFNFTHLYNRYNLSKVPETEVASFVANVILSPRPDILNFRAPPIVELQSALDDFKPALGTSWTTNCYNAQTGAMRKTRAIAYTCSQPLTLGRTSFRFFPNVNDNLDDSCATRVLSLLGLGYPFQDDNALSLKPDVSSDPNKLGVYRPALIRALLVNASPRYMVFFEHDSPDSVLDAFADLHTAFPAAKIIVRVTQDHTDFCVHQQLLDREMQLRETLMHTTSELRLSANQKAELITSYPPNVGRAGARVHITLTDLLTTQLCRESMVILLLAHQYRNTNSLEAVTLVNLALVPYLSDPIAKGDMVSFILRNARNIFSSSPAQLAKYLKKVHSHSRSFLRLPGSGLPAYQISQARAYADNFYGFDALVGRSEHFSLDFGAEVQMRMADPVIRGLPVISPASDSLTLDVEKMRTLDAKVSAEVIRSMMVDSVTPESFSSWYARRMFWAASGGAPGAKVTWTNTSDKPEILRLNKRGALLAIPESHYRAILEKATTPVQWSVKAVKYEPGKLRAILNTSIELYVFQAYILDMFEAHLRSNTWYASHNAGAQRLQAHVRRLNDLREHVGLMWDFADFNVNHTFDNQRNLFYAVVSQIVKTMNLDSNHATRASTIRDMTRIGDYVLQARGNTFIADNDTGLVMQVVRSLQSGERSTSFINSVRNQVDHEITECAAEQLFGHRLSVHSGDKSGDDVFGVARDMKSAILQCALYNLCGFAGQNSKILISYPTHGGGRGEFLRYSYDASNGRVSGYPLRALTGVVHGEFFNEPITDPVSRAATVIEQYNKLFRRGITLPDTLLNMQLTNVTRLVYTEHGRKHVVNVPRNILTIPTALGGAGAPPILSSGPGNSALTNKALIPNAKYAVCIPSGEGKSTLAVRYPDYFVDHDSLINLNATPLREEAIATGNWEKVNAFLRSVDVPAGKVLLTWHADTAPRGFKVKVFMLTNGTGLRANAANRRSLFNLRSTGRVGKEDFHLYADHGQLTSGILAFTRNIFSFNASRVRSIVLNTDGEILKYPKLRLPNLNASVTLRKAKTSVVDYDTLQKFGATRQQELVDESLLASGLTAALPKSALSNALATYASELDTTLKGVSLSSVHIPLLSLTDLLLDQDSLRDEFRNIIKQHISPLPGVGLSRNPLLDRAAVLHPKHHYNSIVSLLRATGCSSGVTLNASIDAQPNTGKYSNAKMNQLYNFIKRAYGATFHGKHSDTIQRYLKAIDRLTAMLPPLKNAHKNLFLFFSGGLQTFPVDAPAYSTEMLSTVRDFVWHFIEHHSFLLLKYEDDVIREYIAFLDNVALGVLEAELQNQYPGFYLHD